ncbi:hypothetical protein A3G67_02815 [Candidatus Roizmanbacteria bacterium RIFCSPLOWO2_12_FULL_40_12]|uniref:Zinc finger DksA/TraR C4-type domain-containing protein n=1 Tax=Candidatus Roizmanbacteria bacterium RIFCSPLOWO2_01_FULL_40_42 TaxID=1802066 RepID=A0A1F7J2N3_9BACT|nr:MAG: hypothetical protein A2779_00345 [Candidatus Roizmanbacteria bacterium RIFCSPHIGHO2_01_FULL_40_98]OGK27509.1 MAG: hypothetical protein A3C31_03500 [Candidatus Roizmanbacteria bacterium RIFCSPHIGHO2_02_FULL_40_53]OGK30265.1 MAG: hypothetical protein A2W49_00985 [Candidatus Roizmanbacteria bacterium RIFCSPHIGHO2_12_41_18]OGK37135.1 MAG: hypothetical protein A3E69_01610 [Candidatus Roizmanbacteria bacterium RIFCSPHIGHO2_12_FULL_40_130]OGK49871.1 MAG: hypothetical protein A3B50_03740 [Candi
MAKKPTKSHIKKIKSALEQEKEKLFHQVEELKKDDPFSDPDHASDNAAIDTDVREQVGHETIVAQIKSLQRRLADIDTALEKISKGKYGLCEKCGMSIPQARLKLIPEARWCVSCYQSLYK